MTASILEAEHITKTFRIPHERRSTVFERLVGKVTRNDLAYEDFKALEGVSFSVEHGESIGLIGPNGSGKSTLLRILSGIYVPDKGRVRIHGRSVSLLELGTGFELDLTGRENIFLYGAILGITRAEVRARMDAIIEFSGIGRFLDAKLKNFSGGMRLRLAFATAIQAPADIYLFDEVMAVGDRAFQEKCIALLKTYQREGRTFVIAHHGLDVLAEFCTRGLYINKGRLADDGPIHKVLEHYKKNVSNENNRSPVA